MSIRLMSAGWDSTDPALAQGSTLLVYLALADFANDEGQAWPLVSTLARKARISERTCQRALSQLERSGWVTRHGQGRHSSAMYVITPRK